MSIRSTFTWLSITLTGLLVALFLILGLLVLTQQDIRRTDERRADSVRIADVLRQGSDDLTRMARLYVATGEPRYRTWYDEIIAIRRGTAPRPVRYDLVYWDLVGPDDERPRGSRDARSLEDLMLDAGFTVEEFNSLRESEANLVELIRIERVAMNARDGRFDDGTGRFVESGSPDPVMARNLVVSDEYMAQKARIMRPINEFVILVEQRTAREVKNLSDRIQLLGLLALGVSIAAVGVASASRMVARRRVLVPLAALEERTAAVADGDYSTSVEYSSDDEFGSLVGTFNTMQTRLGETVGNLEAANEELEARGEALEEARDRADELLLNILPAAITERLRAGETTIADAFPEVTVMFADIVGFTPMTESIGPKETVRRLNDLFGLFDERLAVHGVEKVKTIGDAYMAVAGLPTPAADHAQRIAGFALDVRDAVIAYAQERGFDLQVRIGIHSGAAVAGVIGHERFAYDMWGDVVNTASRMESTGVPGEVHVSNSAKVRLQDEFTFESVGEIEVKGKGRMQTWFLREHRYDDAARAADAPI